MRMQGQQAGPIDVSFLNSFEIEIKSPVAPRNCGSDHTRENSEDFRSSLQRLAFDFAPPVLIDPTVYLTCCHLVEHASARAGSVNKRLRDFLKTHIHATKRPGAEWLAWGLLTSPRRVTRRWCPRGTVAPHRRFASTSFFGEVRRVANQANLGGPGNQTCQHRNSRQTPRASAFHEMRRDAEFFDGPGPCRIRPRDFPADLSPQRRTVRPHDVAVHQGLLQPDCRKLGRRRANRAIDLRSTGSGGAMRTTRSAVR